MIDVISRYVDQLGSVDDTNLSAVPPLMCLVEDSLGGMGPDERVSISMISVSAGTGDVVWDQFEGEPTLMNCFHDVLNPAVRQSHAN